MNIKLPLAILIWFFAFNKLIFAGSIAQQTQTYDSTLNVWQAIQELGSNLSGTATTFTFRVSTSQTNLNQFDYTAQNSRIYDKDNNNSYIVGCVPSGANPNDGSRGLTFTTTDIPSGYENVTIDFSCRNYNFITGHRYLILITNANMPQWGGKRIKFAASIGADRFTGGGVRFAYDNSSCNASNYVWNSQTANSGCNIFSTPSADLFFILNNNAPLPRLPVIFIPGIGGSEFKASQDIVWSAGDGHGGTYSHAYSNNEKIWVNQDEAAALGNDDYFDVLRLKTDGVTAEADLALTGNLTSFGYTDIDSFFTGMGYTKGTNYFVFPYDWRKDVRSTKDDLDALIETAKQKSGQSKVNLVVHSMGGLIARYYISDSSKAAKVNKLIELGVPHLGTPWATKAIMYGKPLGRQILGDFYLGIPASETKDLLQNLSAAFQLLPSKTYFDFYNNSTDNLYPFRDDRDIDNNNITGVLNFDQIKSLLSNLSYNMTVFNFGDLFHSLDTTLNQTNGTIVYEIVGTAQPTLGQIHETWWITWPVNLISKTDEIFINGDGTVPLYSASLKNDSLDISGATKIYYVEQKHSDLVSSSGAAMQTVKAIINDDNSLPVEVKEQKMSLEGQQISVDDGNLDIYDDSNNHTGLKSNGDVEENISGTFYDSIGTTKHIFVKKSKKVTAKITSSNITKTNIKIRNYSQDSITKTIFYNNVPLTNSSTIQFTVNPSSSSTPSLSDGTQTILATSEATGSAAMDQTPPVTTIQTSGAGSATVTLTGTDSGSGILRIEYSLDNGQTVQTYTGPFTVSNSGETIIQVKSIDKTGNEEIPQSYTITIAASPTPTPTPAPTSSSSSSVNTPGVGFDSPGVNTGNSTSGISLNSPGVDYSVNSGASSSDILGVKSKSIDLTELMNQQKLNTDQKTINSFIQNLGGLLIVSGGIVGLAALGLFVTFFKPFPK